MEGANCSGNFMGFGDGVGLSPLMMMPLMSSAPPSKHHQSNNDNSFLLLSNLNSNPNSCNNYNTNNTSASTITTTINNNYNNNYLLVPFNEGDNNIKSRIMSHPHYPRLLAAYVNCHKIGAPPDVVAKLEEAVCNTSVISSGGVNLGEDPALDQFMEAYCEMLTKYEEEISKPFKEAMLFFSRMESQFKSLTLTTASPSSLLPPGGCGDNADKNVSSEDDAVDVDDNYIDPQAEDRELKGQLLRKYSGYLGSLKKEFLKKRKKGKLPKEARQQLLDWWSRHYKWPYPSESQKLALAETTGLDPKQINNWFINQRKRHWKPTDDMQYVVMDASHPTHYYMENSFGGANPFPHLDCGTTLF